VSLNSKAQTNKPYTDKMQLSKDMHDAVKKNDVKKLKEIVTRLVSPYQLFKKEILPTNDKGASDEKIDRNRGTDFMQYNSVYVTDSVYYTQYALDYYLSKFIQSLLNDNKSLAPFGKNTYYITNKNDTLLGSIRCNFISVLFETKDYVNMIILEDLLTIKNQLYLSRQCNYFSFPKKDLPLFLKTKYPAEFAAYTLTNNKFEKYTGDTLLFENVIYDGAIIELSEGDAQLMDASPIIEAESTESTSKQIVETTEGYQESEVFDRAEVMPQFPGGVEKMMLYLKTNLQYPQTAKQNGLEGKVIIKFVIDVDGSIKDPVILKDGIGGGCGDEAIRLVKSMPKWKPGEQRGKPAKVYYTLPVTFRL